MYNVVRLEKMAGTYVADCLYSGKYATVSGETYTPVAVENGMVGKLGGLIPGERELHWVTPVAANTKKEDVVLVASPEYMPDSRLKDLGDFRNEADEPIRVYKLHSGGIFGVTAGCFANAASDAPVVGDIVELTAGTKWNAVTSATSSSTVIGSIIAVDVVGTRTYYVVQID